jgi:hypothetical protein
MTEISAQDKPRLLQRFPQVELSYETIPHTKVSPDYNICMGIPIGTKGYAWMTFQGTEDVCFLLETNKERNITRITKYPLPSRSLLANGTLLYGTIVGPAEFVVEDLLYYEGIPTKTQLLNERLGFLEKFFEEYVGPVVRFHMAPMWPIEKLNLYDAVYEVPKNPKDSTVIKDLKGPTVIENPKDSTVIKNPKDSTVIKDLKGPTVIENPKDSTVIKNPKDSTVIKNPKDSTVIKCMKDTTVIKNPSDSTPLDPKGPIENNSLGQFHHIQYRCLSKTAPYLNVFPTKKGFASTSSASVIKDYLLPWRHAVISKPQYRVSTVFLVRADIQFDIYRLFAYGGNKAEIYYGVACIPNYKTSVMMNRLFRRIHENESLDAAEESEDEADFENVEPDKYVDLAKELLMEFRFHSKWKKWVPVQVVDKRQKVVHISSL